MEMDFTMRHAERMETLQKNLERQNTACALLFYSRDVFYYTGTAQPSYLLVLPDDITLYVRSGLEFALRDAWIGREHIREERRLDSILEDIAAARLRPKRIATELDLLPANRFSQFQHMLPGYEFVDASPMILEQRKVKDSLEIQKLRQACSALHLGHQAIQATLREGITELELAAAVEHAHRMAGHEGLFFIRQPDFFMSTGPISSGPNLLHISGLVYSISGVGLSPSVPAGPSRRRIAKGDPVIVDIPVLVEGYHGDQTRTYVVGRADPPIQDMHQCLRSIADHLIQGLRPGTACREVYELARSTAEEVGSSAVFMNFGRGKQSHLIGHGVGVELNEPPLLSPRDASVLSEGNVVALDMHMLDEQAGAVKLEDMILVTKDGNEILNVTSRELFEI
jgi:Xaa-Pro aminopeptidase